MWCDLAAKVLVSESRGSAFKFCFRQDIIFLPSFSVGVSVGSAFSPWLRLKTKLFVLQLGNSSQQHTPFLLPPKTNTHLHTHTHTPTPTPTPIHTHTPTPTHTPTHTHLHTHTYTYTHTHAYIKPYTSSHTHFALIWEYWLTGRKMPSKLYIYTHTNVHMQTIVLTKQNKKRFLYL